MDVQILFDDFDGSSSHRDEASFYRRQERKIAGDKRM
jgi:hypothetical protein